MPNHLASETSPYLRQHADNPVEWYPWSDEALARAVAEDKPICLSIGYSTCHWCHVMAHESFEDPATAQVMNEHFISIKVDKEERPDIDRAYQTCFQVMNQQGGGWPLTALLSPHTQLPFFIGTYIPDQPRHGMPAFRDVLAQAAQYYRDNGDRIDTHQDRLEAVLRNLEADSPTPQWDPALELKACDDILQAFDRDHGGVGAAPKFPMPSLLQLLLHAGGDSGRNAVEHTLRHMIRGGICDQVGGGFFRYSTDARWEIPHFEKMLYDNGALLSVLAHFVGDDELRRAGLETVAWLEREMHAPGGAFHAAIDADSEGGEGVFYLFDPDEVEVLVADLPNAGRLLRTWLNLDRPANFEGRWHLHQVCGLDAAADATGIARAEARAVADTVRQRLLEHRERRPRPGIDTKVIASWNALAVSGLLAFSAATAQADIARLGLDALDFIRTRLFDGQRLWSTWQLKPDDTGIARHAGYLDDYALTALATWQSLRVAWSNERADWLVATLERMIANFGDDNGGFFFTDRREPALILRDKEFLDNVTPAGNGIAALVLARCGHLFARPDWLRAAEATVRAGWRKVESYPPGGGTLLAAAAELRQPPTLALLQGPGREQWRAQLAAQAGAVFAFALDDGAPIPMAGANVDRTVATVCCGDRCNGPFANFDELRQAVADSRPPDPRQPTQPVGPR